jgi:hypothetical protein
MNKDTLFLVKKKDKMIKIVSYIHKNRYDISTAKPVLRGHLREKEKVAL